MTRIYLSGPISGPKIEQNLHAFTVAAAELRGLGLHVTNPAENGLPLASTWEAHMRADIRDMMDCDTIHMLPGWAKSRGALLEHQIAVALGFAVRGAGE